MFCCGTAVSFFFIPSWKGILCCPSFFWFGGRRIPAKPKCPCLHTCCCETLRASFAMGGQSYLDDRADWYENHVDGDCEFCLDNWRHMERVVGEDGVAQLQMVNNNEAIRGSSRDGGGVV